MFLILLMAVCIVTAMIAERRSEHILKESEEFKEFCAGYISFIGKCVVRLGYNEFQIRPEGIFEGEKVCWLFEIEGYDRLSPRQCRYFSSIALELLHRAHPGRTWRSQIWYRSNETGRRQFDCVNIYPVIKY